MIRGAVLHLQNEQPLLADIESLPTASDVSLVCTNLRLMNGQRPVFVDEMASVFIFPMGFVRFIEIHPASLAAAHEEADGEAPEAVSRAALPAPRGSLESAVARAARPPEPAAPEEDFEIDEDFLRRVRDA